MDDFNVSSSFVVNLNEFLVRHDFNPIEDSSELLEFIKMQIKAREMTSNLAKAKDKDLAEYKLKISRRMRIIQSFLFYIKESLIIPYNLTLTHKERDAINQLLTAKIDQFIENNNCSYDDEF